MNWFVCSLHFSEGHRTLMLNRLYSCKSINVLWTGLFVLCISAKVTYCCTTYSISRMGNLKGVIMSCEKRRIASRAYREIHSTVQSKVQCEIITDHNISERIGNNRNGSKQIQVLRSKRIGTDRNESGFPEIQPRSIRIYHFLGSKITKYYDSPLSLLQCRGPQYSPTNTNFM